jgi:hypothetical protein
MSDEDFSPWEIDAIVPPIVFFGGLLLFYVALFGQIENFHWLLFGFLVVGAGFIGAKL